MTNANDRAFPLLINGVNEFNPGISVREYYAGLAMQGLLAYAGLSRPDDIGKASLDMADALIKALNESK